MAITRTREVTVADVWADDDGGVTLEVGEARASLAIDEAVAFAYELSVAAAEAARAARDRAEGEQVIAEMKSRVSVPDGLGGVI